MRIPTLLITLWSVSPALWAGQIDYDRTTPVPADQPVPIEDYFRAPILRSPVVNETGTHVAALISPADKTKLLIWDIARKQAEGVGGYGDTDVLDVQWLDARHLTFTLTTEKYFSFASMVAEVGNAADAYPIFQYSGSQFIAVPPHDRAHPLFWIERELVDAGDTIYQRPGPVVAADVLRSSTGPLVMPGAGSLNGFLYKAAIQNNERHVWRTYPMVPGLADAYFADVSGAMGYGVGTNDTGKTTLYRLADNGWVPCPVDMEQIRIVGASDRSGQLLALGPRSEGKPSALQYLDPASGKLGDVLYQDPKYDFTGWPRWDHATERIVGVEVDRGAPTTVWFDQGYAQIQRLLDRHFKGERVQILSTSDNHAVILAAVYSDREPRCYYTIDLEHHQVGLLKKSEPWVDPARMQPMHLLRYRTRDGIVLDAYLTLPAGASKAHPVPLIVYPHGGPFYRDSWEYRSDVQFLASLGYAVLQPNYRNSAGYQWRVPEADRWNFGRMSEDVSDAARTALATQLVDPQHVAIVGGSFGGYLAISGVAHDPSLYRCAVSIAGVFDWLGWIHTKKYDQYDSPDYAELKHHLGDPHTDHARLQAMSPINYIRQIRVPVFVYHGEDDLNVEIQQSRDLVAALESNGIPHETMFVSGEGHGPRHLGHEVEMWGRIAAFLKKNL